MINALYLIGGFIKHIVISLITYNALNYTHDSIIHTAHFIVHTVDPTIHSTIDNINTMITNYGIIENANMNNAVVKHLKFMKRIFLDKLLHALIFIDINNG